MTAQRPGNGGGIFLSLVIPAYNEVAGIAEAIAEADQALATLGQAYEIVVVDDGSSDGTARVAIAAAVDRPRVRVLQHAANQGYGAALRTGFEAARGQLVAFTDADCQFDLLDLGKLIPLAGEYPIVTGYRLQRQDSWKRCFFSRGYNFLVRALLGTRVRDCDCALKVYQREALAQILPESKGFFVNSEMLARARQLGLAVAEVGVCHRPRLRGTSKVSLLDIPRTLSHLLPFWWSRVLFAGDKDQAAPDASRPGGRSWLPGVAQFSILLLLSCLVFFAKLSTPLLEPEEARYAEIPRQMLSEHSLAVPMLHGESYFQKPPLVYWLVMAAYQLCGVHDWSARLVPGAAAVLLVLLVYLWGRRSIGDQAAFLAGLILCLSFRFVFLARLITLDGVLSLCVVAALLTAYRFLVGGRGAGRWWTVSALGCGLGLLAKGPVALVLVAVPVALAGWLDRRLKRPGVRAWLVYAGVAVAVAAPWYTFMAIHAPEAAADFFLLHHVVRYVAPLDHARPVWFYLPEMLIGLFPWTLLLFPLVVWLWRKDAVCAKGRPAALGYLLLAFVWCTLFFSCSGCKRSVYLLPALPLLAAVLGCYLAAALPWAALGWRRRTLLWVPRAGAGLARWLTGAALLAGVGASCLAVAHRLWEWEQGVVGSGVMLGLLAVTCLSPRRWGAAGAWTVCVGVLTLIQAGAIFHLLPEYHRQNSLRGQVRRHADWCRGERLPLLCYPRLRDSVSFYLQAKRIQIFAPAQLANMMRRLEQDSPCLVFINSREDLDRFTAALPDSLEFVPCGRQGKRLQVGLVHPRATWAKLR